MSVSLWLNVVAPMLSVVAILVSGTLTLRQIRLARGSIHLPVVVTVFRETRTKAWLDAEAYVLNELTAGNSAVDGIRGLPEQALLHVELIGTFYDDLGKLVAHGTINQDLIVGSYGTPVVDLWDVLAPFVYAERTLYHPHFWVYFEDQAARIAASAPAQVYERLGLGHRPPATPHSLKSVGSDANGLPSPADGSELHP